MVEWTEGAKFEWEKYCEQLTRSLAGSDADSKEVLEDIYRDINLKLADSGTTVVTESDIRHILTQFGLPDDGEVVGQALDAVFSVDRDSAKAIDKSLLDSKPKKSVLGSFYIITFGVVLPIITLLVELATRLCTDAFFDPIPTILHVILFAFIPLSIMKSLATISKKENKYYKYHGYSNAIAIGIASIYSLMFLPLLPISVMAIMLLGLGFCSLSPMLSLIALLMVRWRLRVLTPSGNKVAVPGLFTGMAISVLLMTLAALPSILTRVGISMAISDSLNTQAKGIKLLRDYGNKDDLLDYCYRGVHGWLDLLVNFNVSSEQQSYSPEQLRGIYYRVTGKAYTSNKPLRGGILGGRSRSDFQFDFNQGESAVGAQLVGLTLHSSRMDASVDPDSAIGYLEWTMTFKNSSSWQQKEARSCIQLPVGAVVSRLTLWVDGQEREAAFASRSRTKQAYQNVVSRQRDPVLVTTQGPDRIMVQCFPVPADGGLMKIRVGMTIPLNMISDDTVVLKLPFFNERNFSIPEAIKHSIWIESKHEINSIVKELITESPKENLYALRGEITDSQLSGKSGLVAFNRDREQNISWSEDSLDQNVYIRQTISSTVEKSPEHIVLVIDSSVNIKPVIQEIADSIKYLPVGASVSLVIADDNVVEYNTEPLLITEQLKAELASAIRKIEVLGGKDNIVALEKAWDKASVNSESVILWLYAGQPHIFKSPDTLMQRWERRPDGPRLIQAQVLPAVDKITESFDYIPQIQSLMSTGAIGEDLQRQFEIWSGKPTYVVVREKLDCTEVLDDNSKTSDHLARLCYYDQITNILDTKTANSEAEALAIAEKYQLVTPVSGAVVLESQQQYQEAGLQPVGPETVPTIPEPEVWALMIVVASIIIWVLMRRQVVLKSC